MANLSLGIIDWGVNYDTTKTKYLGASILEDTW